MIQLKPFIYNDFICPECRQGDISTRDVLIEGLHVVADSTCRSCGFGFSQLLPIGHTLDYRISFGTKNLKLYDTSDAWVAKGLSQYVQPPRRDEVRITRTVYRTCKHVVVLNALDFLYGHTLLKLLNCQAHLDAGSEPGLVVIIPSNFAWLIPEGCAEVWAVNLPLSKFHYRYHAIGAFVKEQLERFDSVFLSMTYAHPDCSSIDISRFTGVVPFDLELFNRKAVQITFVLREDRWWLDGKALYFGFQILRRVGLRRAGARLLCSRQNSLVKKTVSRIRKEYPSAQFVVVGLGRTGEINGVLDRRVKRMTEQTERCWCAVYADSHLVIGVHGSNMILPTAHAAGCIEILPGDRLANIVQDIAVRARDRRQLFLYRFVDEFVRPRSVAAHAVSILSGYRIFNRNMCKNQPVQMLDHDKDHGLHDFHHRQEQRSRGNFKDK